MRVNATSVIVLLASIFFSLTASAATISDVVIREIDVPGLPDVAMAEMTSEGPVILYNPELFRAAGPARAFVRAHERAHVVLAHLVDPWMIDTDEGRREAEAEADCFAAKSAPPLSVVAMARLLFRRAAEPADAIYGKKSDRARRILRCAGIAPDLGPSILPSSPILVKREQPAQPRLAAGL